MQLISISKHTCKLAALRQLAARLAYFVGPAACKNFLAASRMPSCTGSCKAREELLKQFIYNASLCYITPLGVNPPGS